MELGIAGVAAITVIAYLIGQALKASALNNKWIPVICGVCGGALGAVAMRIMPDFPATDYISAVAVGIVSGLAATGINQIGKQISIALHTFARRTKTAVIALSQLSRPEKGAKRRPRLSDLRSSGQIEQDADVDMTLSLKDSDDRSGPR